MEKSLSCLGLLAVTRLPSCQVGALARPSPAVRFPRNRHRMGDVSMVEWPHLENTPETYPREVLPPMARSPLILDRYRVIDQAGSGGYGTVVHAFDTHLKRDVAIKCIELSEDELAAARLEALEARMAADLEEVEAGASGAETGVAGRNAGPGAVSAAGAGMGATAGDPAGSSSAAAFPADPDFLAARDERRRRRSATAVSGAPPRGCRPGRTGTTSVILTMTLSMSLVQMILMLRQPKTNGGTPSFPGTPPRPTSPVGGAGRRASRVG